jgi:hypothetical protein
MYLELANKALNELAQGARAPGYDEKNEINEERFAAPVVTAFRESFPTGVDSIPFNQPAMEAIKARYPVRVWLGVVNEWAWWVRGEAEREKLLAEGENEPIYTLGELAVVLSMDEQDLKNVHALKRHMGAVISPVKSK